MPDSLKQSLNKCLLAHNPSRVVMGFSGGLDSTALLHGLVESQAAQSFPIPILAIHVHHGLSKNADQWLQHCQHVCADYDIELITEHVTLDDKNGSLENAARNARYEVFARHMKQGDVLLLAHHQNDQVETFLMRLMRGSGLTGLSAMQSVRTFSDGIILRPWLQHTRNQLETYVAANALAYIEDESNSDTQFDRNWWRHKLLPKLTARYPQASTSIIKSIEVLQQERELLHDLLTPIYHSVIKSEPRFSAYPTLVCETLLAQTPRVQTQLIRMWLMQQNVYPALNHGHIQVLFSEVVTAKEGATPIYQWQQHQIRRYAGKLYLLPKTDNSVFKPENSGLGIKTVIETANGPLHQMALVAPLTGCLNVSENVKSGLLSGHFKIIPYQAGLTAKPLKRPTKTLKNWFQEFAVPPWLRDAWPVFISDGEVVCVPGLFSCDGFTDENGLNCEYQSLVKSLHLPTF